eukprot:896407-Amphidinium_carterae.2
MFGSSSTKLVRFACCAISKLAICINVKQKAEPMRINPMDCHLFAALHVSELNDRMGDAMPAMMMGAGFGARLSEDGVAGLAGHAAVGMPPPDRVGKHHDRHDAQPAEQARRSTQTTLRPQWPPSVLKDEESVKATAAAATCAAAELVTRLDSRTKTLGDVHC